MAAVALPWLVYLRTVAPTVYGLDSAELTTAAYVLGVNHAPGAPLFLLLGHVFAWLPLGDVGYRVNLLSSCAAAAALAFVFGIHRRLGSTPLLALAATWLLAFSYYYWIAALAAELYALQALVLAALIWLAMRWREQLTLLRVCTVAVLFGIGLGAHLSLILIAPGLALLLLSGTSQSWNRASWWLAAAVAALLGACVYLYLPLRSDAPMNYARDFGIDLRTWSGFWWMVSGRMFEPRLLAVPPAQWPGELGLYAVRLWSNFLGVGCLLGAIGLAADFTRRPAVHGALLLMWAAHLVFILTYAVSDKEVMFVPTYVIWNLWIGLGAAALVRFADPTSRRALLAPSAIVAALAVAALGLNFAFVDVSEDWSARRKGEAILARLPSNSVFIGTWRDVPLLEYLRLVEGRRADVETVNLFFVPASRRSALVEHYGGTGRPLFTSEPAGLKIPTAATRFDPHCDCFEVTAASSPDPTPADAGFER